ncbi:MAG: LptF/LptG family permease [Bacteroidales bacterium]
MKKIYLYIIKSYFGPFVMTFTISLFILVMQFLWKYVDDMVGKGLDWFIILELLFYAAATFVPLALPLAILFASLMTFGNLGERYELVAMKAAGISLSKAMKPLVGLSLLISLAAFFFSNNVLPVANLKMFTLLNDVRQKKPAVNIRPGIFYNEIDGIVIKIAGKEKDGKGVKDIIIYDYTTPEASRYNGLSVTLASKGEIEMSDDERFMTLTLIDGVNYHEKIESRDQVQSRPLQRTSFASQKRTIDLSAFAFSKTNEEFFKDDFRMLSIRQLNNTIDSMYGNYYTERETYTQEMFRVFRNLYADTLAPDTPRERIAPVDSMLLRRRSIMLTGQDPLSPIPGDSVLADEIPRYHPQYGDSISPKLLDNFREEEQGNIVSTALQIARSTKETMASRFSILDSRIRLIRKYEIEWHRKFTLSFACLILFFIGAPLGAIIRKGGLGMPAVVSVVLFIVFHVLSMTGDKLARESTVSPAGGMWMASLIILPAGIFLTIKATSDAALLDMEAWGKLWKRITGKRNHDQGTTAHQ